MNPLLELTHISKTFHLKGKHKIHALKDINLTVYPGETLGIVGESGCGKSTLARVIMGAHTPDAGQVFLQGQPVNFGGRKNRLAFAQKVQMIFQDPYTCLNPRMKVGDIVGESFVIHKLLTPQQRQQRVLALLGAVGLQPEHAGRFPSEFSGGQRQRIGIARALALNPALLVCDEPISALDVSIQSQIMNLLKQLAKDIGLTYVFIAHDLSMVHYISSRVAVMYMGQIVELADAKALYKNPCHPYTQLLWQAVLSPNPQAQQVQPVVEPPASTQQSTGCAFAPRCPRAQPLCFTNAPSLGGNDNHQVACHLAVVE